MKNKLIFVVIAVGIGTFFSYFLLLHHTLNLKIVPLWYMEDIKGIKMFLVSEASFAKHYAIFPILIESFISPLHSLLMIQVVKDLYGFLTGYAYTLISITLGALPLFVIGKNIVNYASVSKTWIRFDKEQTVIVFGLFVMSTYIIPIPMIAFIFGYLVKQLD